MTIHWPRCSTRYVRATLPWILASLLAGCSSGEHSDHDHAHDHRDDAESSATVTNRIAIPDQVRRNLGITFARIELRRMASTLRLPGRFELLPTARREYHAALPGRVELAVHQYDTVTTGQVLYRLDSPDWRKIQQEIAEAEAQVRATSATLVQAQIAIKGGSAASAVARRRMTAGQQHVESLRQSLAAAEARLSQTEKVQRAVGGKLSDLSEARAKVAEARTALTQAEEEGADIQREALRQSTEGTGAFAASASLEAALLARQAEHMAAMTRQRVARATAASVLGLDEAQLDDTGNATTSSLSSPWQNVRVVEVRAASAGVVQSLEATSGAYVEATKPVLVVVDPTQIRFRAVALQSDLELLRDSIPARISAPSGANRPSTLAPIAGILSLAPEADPDQRSIDVIVTPSATPPWAKAGIAAYAEAVTDDSEDPVPAIPIAAVLQDDLQKIYFRRDPTDPDKVIRVEADLGVSDGDYIAVESGLKQGDEVVLGGVYQLKLAGGGKATKAGHFHADGTFHDGKD